MNDSFRYFFAGLVFLILASICGVTCVLPEDVVSGQGAADAANDLAPIDDPGLSFNGDVVPVPFDRDDSVLDLNPFFDLESGYSVSGSRFSEAWTEKEGKVVDIDHVPVGEDRRIENEDPISQSDSLFTLIDAEEHKIEESGYPICERAYMIPVVDWVRLPNNQDLAAQLDRMSLIPNPSVETEAISDGGSVTYLSDTEMGQQLELLYRISSVYQIDVAPLDLTDVNGAAGVNVVANRTFFQSVFSAYEMPR